MRSQKTLCRKPFREDKGEFQGDAEMVIAAEEFQLVDKEGRMRAVLALEDDQPGLYLFDKEESLRASFCLDERGEPYLDMLDKGDVTRVVLWVNEGESNLTLCDKEGRFRVQIFVPDDDEGPGVAVMDEVGRPCLVLGIGDDREGSLEFFDKAERRQPILRVADEDDEPAF